MKTILFIGVVVAILTSGCDEPIDKSRFNHTFIPTNHWKVVGQGSNGLVIVETKSTNLLSYLRVQVAKPMVAMTNGQPAWVEMTARWDPIRGSVVLISSRVYPAAE